MTMNTASAVLPRVVTASTRGPWGWFCTTGSLEDREMLQGQRPSPLPDTKVTTMTKLSLTTCAKHPLLPDYTLYVAFPPVIFC